jgi:hypothetical protein
MPSARYSLRAAVVGDLPRLYALDRVSRDDTDRRSSFHRAVREARSWVIEQQDDVVGHGIVSHEFFGRSFLDLIYIDEKCRGLGLGEAH